MRTLPIVALIVLLVTVASAQQKISENEIEAAIKCGLGQVKCDRPILTPGGLSAVMLDWSVTVTPPLGRIYVAARNAKDKYLPFARADVSEDMLASEIHVFVESTASKMTELRDVEHVVILPRGKNEGAVQPSRIDAVESEVKNLAGASFKKISKRAVFKLADLPPGEFDIVVVSSGARDFRAGVREKDRQKLTLWSGAGS